MKFRNPFKRRKTAAEIIDTARAIALKYGITEAYYKYDNMCDLETDRPEWIRLTYALEPSLRFEDSLAFRHDLHEALGESIGPFTAFPGDQNFTFAKEHYVPLF